MQCFVIMPFGNPDVDKKHSERQDSIYNNWIKPAVNSIEIPGPDKETMTCHRADKSYRPGEIIMHVIQNLLTAEIVIADMSGKNSNVFYELGVRHAVKGNCILISDNVDDIPFDLRSLKTIIYKYEPDEMLNLQQSIKKAILEILSSFNTIDNPVQRFIYNRKIEQTLEDPNSQQYALVKNLLAEMTLLRSEQKEQKNEVLNILKLITSTSNDKILKIDPELQLKAIEGIWSDAESGSVFYIAYVNGQLKIPYSFGRAKILTAQVHDIRFISNTLIGKFEWFLRLIEGYIFFKIHSDTEITGGWWSAEPRDELMGEIEQKDFFDYESNENMTRMVLNKIGGRDEFPLFVRSFLKRSHL